MRLMLRMGELGVELHLVLLYGALRIERAEPQEASTCARPFVRDI